MSAELGGGHCAEKKKKDGEAKHNESWMGIVKLPGGEYHRRLDIKARASVLYKLTPALCRQVSSRVLCSVCVLKGDFGVILPQVYSPTTMPFALLSFTGSDYFNRSMRHYAKRKGLSLSDHGVQKMVR